MSFSHFPTSYEYMNGDMVCVYCGNSAFAIDDSFDEHGQYEGSLAYCTCEKAKIEQQMKREIEHFKDKEKEINAKYKDQLKPNLKALAKAKLEQGIGDLASKEIMYGELHGMTKEEFLDIAGKQYDKQVWGD